MSIYVVTGAAGFVGSAITRELVSRGEAVRAVDNFETGKRENLPSGSKVDLVEGDLAEEAVARRAVDGCEFVLHQAAIPSVPRSVPRPV